MRIISGKYKGRNINGFSIDGTRPTMDRVKESLFGMIQSYIKDSICLDLFAGSGNLAFEAISNGSKLCYFNDKNIMHNGYLMRVDVKGATTNYVGKPLANYNFSEKNMY